MALRGLVLIFLFILSMSFVSSIGISPAIKNINFEPGKQVNITFYVLDAVEGSVYDISLRGGKLVNFSYLSVTQVVGAGSFTLTINFPYEFDDFGEQAVSVSVKERPSETSFINTLIEIGSIVKTFVPYQGYYGDLNLNIPDVNVNEQIPVELYVINRGDNPLEIKEVFVDFISSNGNIVDTLNFTPVNISVSGDRYFRKYLSSERIEPGNYIGSAKVYYQDIISEVNRSFRVGSLFVNVSNYTNYIIGKGIKKFYVSLESRWNSPIYGAYVDVNLTNGEQSTNFRTPSIDILPWEEKTIESYIDTENLDGSYDLYLNATYHSQSTFVKGSLIIVRDYEFIVYIISALVAIVVFIVLYFIVKKLFFKGKRK